MLSSRSLSHLCAFGLAASAAGCYPTMPPPLAESTEVLQTHKSAITVAAGGAPLAVDCCAKSTTVIGAGGGEVRFRVGVGARSEVGASIFGGLSGVVGSGDQPFTIGGKLSYKIAPTDWLAFVVDAGVMDYGAASVAVGSGALAAIVAPVRLRDGSQLYVGARGAFAIPVIQGATNVNESIAVPIGFAWHTSPRVRFLLETGPLFGFAQQSTPGAATQSTATAGAYGAAAFMFIL